DFPGLCGLKFSAMVTAQPNAPERPAEEDFNLNCLRIIRTVYPKQSRTVEQDGSRDPLRCAFCRKIAIPYTAGGKKSS
ncbi:MAG: hypothetical protein IKP09_09960, partial [Lentisphaeria bacterium]|nr:hypothetical protein [Lentisphaeria bacterium]